MAQGIRGRPRAGQVEGAFEGGGGEGVVGSGLRGEGAEEVEAEGAGDAGCVGMEGEHFVKLRYDLILW